MIDTHHTAQEAPAQEAPAAGARVGRLRPLPAAHRRFLAPDLARGMMLLFIALANVVAYLYGSGTWHGGRPLDPTGLDRVLNTVVSLFIDSRSYPMFTILVGFGIATMARRTRERGGDARRVRAVLARRHVAMFVLGMAHAALLFIADVLAYYGATGLIALFLVHRERRVLIRVAAGCFAAQGLMLVYAGWSDSARLGQSVDYFTGMSYVETVGARVGEHLVAVALGTALPYLLGLMIVGMLIARAGLLDRPGEHVPALRRATLVGVMVNLVGGLPFALAVGQVWNPSPGVTIVVYTLHGLAGDAMGVAYVCLFALVAARIGARGPGWVGAGIAATGQRSLTCYLLQSVMFAPLLSSWGLGYGDGLSTTGAYGLAVLVWLVTVAIATGLARAGWRGPFEVLLRRLTHGGDQVLTRGRQTPDHSTV